MRKILAWCLILCLSVSLVNVATAGNYFCKTETEMRTFYETHKNDEDVRDHFVLPSELNFLGEFQVFFPSDNGLKVWSYSFKIMDVEKNPYIIDLIISFYDRDWNEYASAVSGKDVEIQPIGINLTKENMLRLQENVVTESDQWFRIKRGELEYIYCSTRLDTIVWKHSGISFRLELGDTRYHDMGDSALSALFSLEEEPFLEAERLLFNISNLNPILPEPEKACGGEHVYGTQWKSDYNTHWYPCICGAKSEQGFHMDENQDGVCDICLYDLNGENVSDPVVDPVQPTQPTEPTEPATQPTEPTQPTTAAPTAPPTQPSPAEPDAPSVGLWIGISAAVLATAAALLLLRKKK